MNHSLASKLPTDAYTFWHRVPRAVPPRGLIFTALAEDTLRAYYYAVARRQIFNGTWIFSLLRAHEQELARRIEQNHAVLKGRLSPADIPAARGYSGYYAVVGTDDPPPKGGKLVFSTETL